MAESANAVIRYGIGDYIQVSGETYALLGLGVVSLDENPGAKIDKQAFINDRSASGTVTGYENSFAFDAQLRTGTDAEGIEFIYGIGRDQKTGADAETYYCRVDLYKGIGEATSYPARRFKVAVEVAGVTGAGTEIMRVTGNLHQVGNFEEGTFDTATKTFTSANA